MENNPVIQTILDHKSIRKYTDESPSDEVIETIVRAGQRAPFSIQLYSVILSRNKENPWKAPLLFTICVDSHKFERIMAERNWKLVTNDLTMMLFGIQDAVLMAENMVIAGRSLGLGSCFLAAIGRAEKIADDYNLPKRVFPLVQLAMGYPAENPPTRPRYPLEFTLFENEYPKLDQDTISRAMKEMDDGFLAQDFYRHFNYKVRLEKGRKETFTFDNYSWTEHVSRKWGQWYSEPNYLLRQFEKRGFYITGKRPKLFPVTLRDFCYLIRKVVVATLGLSAIVT